MTRAWAFIVLFILFSVTQTSTALFEAPLTSKYPSTSRSLASETDLNQTANYPKIFQNIYTFCGSWRAKRIISQESQFSISTDEEYQMIVNTTIVLDSIDLILFNSSYFDQDFLIIPFTQKELLENLNEETMIIQMDTTRVAYRGGKNFLHNEISFTGTCQFETMVFKFINIQTSEPFNVFQDAPEDLSIEMEFQAKDGLFSFETVSLGTCKQQLGAQPWIYVILNIVRAVLNLFGAVAQDRRGLNQMNVAFQFIIIFALNCYIYFLNVELAHFITTAIFAAIPISLFSVALDYTVMLNNFERCTALSVALSCIILTIISLYIDNGIYLLIAPFALTFSSDLYKVVSPSNQSKFSLSIYLGYLLPIFLILAYLKIYPYSFAKLTPQPWFVTICGTLLISGMILANLGTFIQKLRAKRRKAKYLIELKEISIKEVCPICMSRLKQIKSNKLEDLESPLLNSDEQEDKNGIALVRLDSKRQEKIIKTPCQHKFHEKCLTKWLERKADCPYCRKPIPELA